MEPFDLKLEDKGVQELLNRLQARMINLKRPLGAIGEVIVSSIARNFMEGGRWSGKVGDVMGGSQKWQDLAESTKKARAKMKKWPGKILVLSGSAGLMGSISRQVTEDSVIVGTNKEYARVHQFGAVIHMKGGTRTLRLRTTASGDLVRQGKEGLLKNLARFARAEGSKAHKRFKEVGATVKPYDVTIPARPFLVVQLEDLVEISNTILDYLVDGK